MFYWATKHSKFPADKWRFDKTDSHCSVALSKSNVFFVDVLQIEDKFHCQESMMGCPLMREREQKKNPIFIFKLKCPRPLTRECPFA